MNKHLSRDETKTLVEFILEKEAGMSPEVPPIDPDVVRQDATRYSGYQGMLEYAHNETKSETKLHVHNPEKYLDPQDIWFIKDLGTESPLRYVHQDNAPAGYIMKSLSWKRNTQYHQIGFSSQTKIALGAPLAPLLATPFSFFIDYLIDLYRHSAEPHNPLPITTAVGGLTLLAETVAAPYAIKNMHYTDVYKRTAQDMQQSEQYLLRAAHILEKNQPHK